MSLYQRYVVADLTPPSFSTLNPRDYDSQAWDVLVGVLYGRPPCRIWEDCDLTRQQLCHAREPGTGPLAIVGVTSAPSVPFAQGTGFYTCMLSYADLERPKDLSTIIGDRVKRVVVLDFGSREKVVEDIHSWLQADGPSVQLTMLTVGGEAKVYRPEEMAERFARAESLSLIQANTSPLRERAIEVMGEEAYSNELNKAWRTFKEKGGIPGIELSWGKGGRGWKSLCAGEGVGPGEGVWYASSRNPSGLGTKRL